ncbi:MAG: DNA polymerase III subunit gamma/tau [Thermoanaerobacteraceae bacterium]|nr:DNA polymerase III subunit gamma/tau [Thermoanaerobacteraceae bacterium]
MYTALYRRFRPSDFDEVVGQEAIVTSLKNQIKNNMVSHAYLFTGSRGTGKTSMAKIFAKAVNCLEPIDGNPCNHCKNCLAIANGDSTDIIEIDAASNNGVNNIRELREDVKYPPSVGKYRVYIIDEVHMLSQGAFNALLKTLEEPPAYIIFILATTDPQKVPVTISSRCQRYDFKRIPANRIVDRLMDISKEVNITLQPEAALLIARKAEGALRDALSILDECIAFCGSTIARNDVLEVLGITAEDSLAEIIKALNERDASRCVGIVDQEYMNGKDPAQFTRDLIGILRDLLFIKTVNGPKEMLDLPESEYKSLNMLSSMMDIREIIRIIDALTETEHSLRYATQPLIVLETSLIKLCLGAELAEDAAPKEDNSIIQRTTEHALSGTQNKDINRPVKKDKVPENRDKGNDIKGQKASLAKAEPDRGFDKLKSAWPNILSSAKQKSMVLFAYLTEGTPVGFDGSTLKISYKSDGSFFREEMEKPENSEIVENIIKEITGLNVKMECIIEGENEKEDEFMARVFEVFDGMDIKIMKE